MRNMQTIFQPQPISQNITTNTTTATAATAIGDQTYAIRLISTTDAYVDFEGAATRTGGMFLAANHPEVFALSSKAVISTLADTVAGKICITELTS